jgi:hypothetical protein
MAWPVVRSGLEAEPDRTAKELFSRLQDDQPGAFGDGQLRTMQRRVSEWRVGEAKRLVFGAAAMLEPHRSPEINAIAADLSRG